MPSAAFIARLVGPVFVAAGVGILLNRTLYSAMIADAVRNPVLIYFSGLAVLTAGLAIVNVHPTWTSDWRVVITVLGWLFVIGGIIRIVLPRAIAWIATAIYSGPAALTIAGIVTLVVGAFLSFKGYRQ